MDLPALVTQRLGEETVRTAVALGEDDLVCVTPTRALVYSGEGILSDESVESFPLDPSRLRVDEGRRKTTFELQYVEGPRTFAVPSKHADAVLEALLAGILREQGIADPDESVVGVYQFSELTVAITDRRLVKHVGANAWDEDYEVFPYEDVTGLDFEEGSVATAVVLGVEGRLERIKAPNDEAPLVRRDLETALLQYHGADSVADLNEQLGWDDRAAQERPDSPGGFDLEDEIEPLVTDRDESSDSAAGDEGAALMDPGPSTGPDESPRPQSMAVDPTSGSAGSGEATEREPDATPEPDARTGFDEDDGSENAGDTGTSPGPDVDIGAEGPGGTGGTGGESMEGETAEPLEEWPANREAAGDADRLTRADLEELEADVEDLREAVAKQNDLLRKHHRALRRILAAIDDE